MLLDLSPLRRHRDFRLVFGVSRSIVWGGLICFVGVALCIPALPGFWRYRRPAASGEAPRP